MQRGQDEVSCWSLDGSLPTSDSSATTLYLSMLYVIFDVLFNMGISYSVWRRENIPPPPSFVLILYPIGRTNERINERGLLLCIMELFHFVSSFAFMLQGSYITTFIYF